MSTSTLWESIGKSFVHTVSADELEIGDHLYVYRAFYAFSHHGIYVGKWKNIQSAILKQIDEISGERNLEFYKRLKQSISIFIDKGQQQHRHTDAVHNSHEYDEKQSHTEIALPFGYGLTSSSRSITDRLDAVRNKKQVLSEMCAAFEPDDDIVIHLSGTVDTGPLVAPCTLRAFVEDGTCSCKYLNVLKRVKYECGYLEFAMKRSGSCSTVQQLSNKQVTLQRAIAAVGWDEYSVTAFNCESFCYYAKTWDENPISHQADTIQNVNSVIEGTGKVTKDIVDFIAGAIKW
mmetsp:Transcript_42791/g.68685  ORF Transcript_42791/g.68685 Transcript_42791/m.68685 type:complete len:290 (-) Transcript_42791:60-929(-)